MIPVMRAYHAPFLASALLLACSDDAAQSSFSGSAATATAPTSASTSTTDEPTTDVPTTAGSFGTGSTTDPGATTASTGVDDPGTTGEPPCPQGQIVCDGGTASTCDGMGGFSAEETCPAACVPGLGCVACVPGEGTCDGDVATQCKQDGSGFEDIACDPVQGVACEGGACVGACSPAALGDSYIGCDYYAVVTPNLVSTIFDFAVVVSNTSADDATVTITRGDQKLLEKLVPKNSVEVIVLPWVNSLKAFDKPSQLQADGAYRVRSTRPITLYQYNPLAYIKDGGYSYTNDASLLMPTNVWSKDVLVVARNAAGYPGFYAVTAREDGTKVTLAPSATGQQVQAGGGVAADGTGVVTLDEGDVLVVKTIYDNPPSLVDLTGTRVTADRPVMVLGGHVCTNVPFNVDACDHLEELNLPVDNLSRDYLVTAPWVKPPNKPVQIKARIVRITATTDGTTLAYDPPQNGAPTAIAKAGDYVEFETDRDFRISADSKVAVSEYMLGQQAGGDTGDPAMTIAVPLEQYRGSYSFHAPINYESNFANITAPTGAVITLDGQPIAGLVPIGNTGFGVARVELGDNGDGDHALVGDQSFGVQVYGYGQYTSYWYPGGLDLKLIPQ